MLRCRFDMGTRHYRAHQRYPVEAGVTIVATGRQMEARGRLLDLGLGGAACELDSPLRLGEPVMAKIQALDDKRSFAAIPAEIAWVAWAEGSAVRLGLRFDDEAADTILPVLDLLVTTADVGT